MARFIGFLKGSRGEVTRLGTPSSGISATAQGWNIGGRVETENRSNVDHVTFTLTAGTNLNRPSNPLVEAWIDVNGVLHIRTFKVEGAVYEL